MWRIRLTAVLLPLCGLMALPAARAQQGPPAQVSAKGQLTAQALGGRIDEHIGARWRREGVKPVPPAGDAVYFRRISLDLTGKIPQVDHVSDFLEDDRPDKRAIWVDKLLESDAFAEHFANVYRTLMLPQVENQEALFLVGGFETWLRKKLKDNTPYDKLVHELLFSADRPNNNFRPDDFSTPSTAAFFAANENKPENLAGTTARLFLGVKIECAQCHKHPFADWTRTQFWEFAAFFKRTFAPITITKDDKPEPKESATSPSDGPQIEIPKTEQVVKAKFLDGTAPKWNAKMDPNKVVADWITARDNPYFAKAAVNQLWHYFYGIGLVEPFDDFGDHNPASHQELLDELADHFVKNGFDAKYLMRAMVLSKTYQLSSIPLAAQKKQDDELENLRLFARMPLRALTGEQLFDSLAEVRKYPVDRKTSMGFGRGLTPREEFVSKFTNPEQKRVDTHSSILQALHLMNGKVLSDVTSLDKNPNLRTIADSNDTVPNKISSLYRLALSRPPRPDELERMTRYVMAGGARNDRAQALADVLWVLVNSAEFAMNH